MASYFKLQGNVRGSCVHKHRTIHASAKCQSSDDRMCVNAGYNGQDISNSFSDRRLKKFDSKTDREVTLSKAEQREFNDDYFLFRHA